MNLDRLQNYQLLAKQYQTKRDFHKKRLKLLSYARLISFIALVPGWVYLYPVSRIAAMLTSLLILGLFLFLIKKFIQTEKLVHFYQRLEEINLNEIRALNRDYSPFDPGSEFIDPHHAYSFDLDLFGNGSLFQFLNRTVTASGKIKLASHLKESQRQKEEILKRQAAIQELADELNWRQHFLAIGKETEEQKNQNHLNLEFRATISLKSEKTIKILLATLPTVTLLLVALKIFGFTTNSIYLIPIFIQWCIFILYSKTISKFHSQFENQAKLLSHYSEMLQKIETANFSGNYLTELQQKLKSNKRTASEITFELQKILEEFDYKQNLLIGFLLNSVFLWDLRCISKLHEWQQHYSTKLPQWFAVISETDALVSLANCNFNHPEWTTPDVRQLDFLLKANDLGHPLIDETRLVRNSFHLINPEQIAIITGANMAGKSTFLRSVGINLILASNGCKVCAQSFEFSPMRVYTNMRTTDNLMNDESYFFAELLRLEAMLNLIRNGENVFVIIDEMLKGTNSVDKLNGSKELLRQLIALKTHGIIATHDLGLTELARQYPISLKNLYFEVQINNNELSFDYKLNEGVTQTMNATFLMKKMGIIPNQEKVIGQ
jgi:DNA mismatch repair ATPase MutS